MAVNANFDNVIREMHYIELLFEKCQVNIQNMDSELLDKYDVFFDFKRLVDHRYLMTFKRYRRNGRHPKTVAWLEFHKDNGVIDSSNNLLGHVLNSLYYEGAYYAENY
jgi:hypothetical protein